MLMMTTLKMTIRMTVRTCNHDDDDAAADDDSD